MLGVCDVALQEVRICIFNILPNSQESMKGQGMCEMHISSYWEEVINAQNCSKTSQIKLWSIVYVHAIGVYNKLQFLEVA
jgi:hypothetical protein